MVLHIAPASDSIDHQMASKMTEYVPSDNIDSTYLALLEQLDEAAIITDDAGRVLYAAPNVGRVLGKTNIKPGIQITRLLGNAAQLDTSGEMRDLQCTVIDSSGSTRYLLVRVKRVNIGDGTRLYLCRCASEAGLTDFALRESEGRLRAVISAIPDLILRIRSDNYVVEYIPANGSDMALLPEPIHLSELVSPEAAESLIRATAEALHTGRMKICEYDEPVAEGVVLTEEARVVVDGPDTVLAIVRDVTERKLILAALETRERTASQFQYYLKQLHEAHVELAQIEDMKDFYRRVIEIGLEQLGFDRMGLMLVDYETNDMIGVYGTDPDGQPRDESHYRVSLDSEDGRVWKALNQKDYVSVWEDIPITEYGEDMGNGWNAIIGVWDGDQAIAYLSVDNFVQKRPMRPYETDLLSLYGSTVGSLIVRKRAENTLRASENRFRTLLEAAPLGVLLMHRDGKILSANHKSGELFGYEQGEFDQINVDDLIPPAPSDPHHVTDFFDNPNLDIVGLDLYGQRKDGYLFPLDIALGYIGTGSELLAMAFIADVTERKLSDEQRLELRVERERTGILTNFIRDAAHEFRTPLSIINTNLYLLDKVTEPERRVELQERIQEQADSITRLVEVLTTMVRLDYGVSDDMAPVNINNIVRAMFTRMQPAMDEKSLVAQFKDTEHVALVNGDASDLTLALSCLVENAVRYTPPGGHISLSTERDGDYQVISITDTGIGMETDVMSHIFERFYRADYARTTRGFGLGLSIARKIIEYHEGSIQVESTPNVGSTFRVRLPLLAP
jgi:PAS domain S-box-containing protein